MYIFGPEPALRGEGVKMSLKGFCKKEKHNIIRTISIQRRIGRAHVDMFSNVVISLGIVAHARLIQHALYVILVSVIQIMMVMRFTFIERLQEGAVTVVMPKHGKLKVVVMLTDHRYAKW